MADPSFATMADCICRCLPCGEHFVRKVQATGTFFCPVCMGKQRYEIKRLWSYCQICYIPLVCQEKYWVDYVKCNTCRNKFAPAILKCGPKDIQTAVNTIILKVMVKAMIANGKIEKNEVKTICRIYEERSGTKITASDVYSQVVIMEELHKDDIVADIAPFARVLIVDEKKNVVAAMVEVSMADGVFSHPEAVLVQNIASVLGLRSDWVQLMLQTEHEACERRLMKCDDDKVAKMQTDIHDITEEFAQLSDDKKMNMRKCNPNPP